jgi:DNA repair exonuclease SbcCD ATPase subunit
MIKFKKVRFKNFGSFGNTFTELILDKNSTTLICGNNGSGKSFAFLDSITFALFGKPFRKINIPQMANSINKKQCLVEIEFSKGGDEYLVKRGLNPKTFEIYKNSNLINQDAKNVDYQNVLEEQILKMNYKTFTQVVILGSSSFVPFMQLSAADRRAVIENILDISVFSTMNVMLKGKLMQIKENLKDLTTKIEIETTKINSQKNLIESLEKRSQEDVELVKAKIEQIEEDIKTYEDSIKLIKSNIKTLQLDVSDKDKIKKSLEQHNKVKTKIDVNLSNIKKEILFFTENTQCPTCKQELKEEDKTKEIQKRNTKQEEYLKAISELTTSISEISSRNVEIENKVNEISNLNTKLLVLINSKDNAIASIESLKKQTQRIEQQQDIPQQKVKLQTHLDTIKSYEKMKTEMRDELDYYEYAFELLKDTGVKAKIIKYYLPFMNKYINKFLTSMDFFTQFTLDEEFNEVIKSRYRDEFSYMNFSEGEKMRIDLALLLAWREIARLKNSVNCNLLILDEVFDSSLDSVGIDELMKLINIVSNKSNIFIISHKSDQLVDKFNSVITFEKKNNFSRML